MRDREEIIAEWKENKLPTMEAFLELFLDIRELLLQVIYPPTFTPLAEGDLVSYPKKEE